MTENQPKKQGRGRPKTIDRKNSTHLFYDIPILHKEQMVEIADKLDVTQTEAFIKMVQEAYHAHFGSSEGAHGNDDERS